MQHTVDTLMALALNWRLAGSASKDEHESILRTALTEALGFRPDWADFENGRECGKLEVAQPVREPLTSDQLMALTLCHEDKRVSVAKVQRILKISYKEAQELCQSIIDAGQCEGFEIAPNLHSIGGDK